MAKTNSTALAITPEVAAMWTPAQIDLIRDMSAKNCTDDEFKVLLYVAHQYHLDPLTKQIYAQKYNDKPAAIIITYAGMLEIANRGNLLDGLSSEIVYDNQGKVAGARSTLWKKGCGHPFQTEVDLEEYIQRGRDKSGKEYIMGLWGSKPKTMIRKVACAQNIRQAFSLGQMYIEEEMPQAEAEPAPQETFVRKPDPARMPALAAQPAPAAPAVSIDENERVRRVGDGAAIDLSYGVETVNEWGEFLRVSMDDTLDCLNKMVGVRSFQEIAKLIGLPGLEGEIKRRYPDTQVQPQRFAATLHFVYNWAKEQARHQAEKEAAHAQAG